jgi:hypothetical protein
MALDDFDTQDSAAIQATRTAPAPIAVQANKAASSEDEDLFDFPVVLMKLETEVVRKPAPASATPAAATKPVATPALAAEKPAAPTAPAAKAAPVKSTSGAARPQEKQDVAKAAQLVEDIEHVLGADGKPRKRAVRLRGPSPLALAGIAALVLTNVFGLFLLWRTSQTVDSGVQAMNRRFAESLRMQSQTPPAPVVAQGSKSGPQASSADAKAAQPLEAFELTALQMAREEIQAGEYAGARQRLSRLLAAADRIEVESRAEIEAQASFLLASTYRKQAEAAREKSP